VSETKVKDLVITVDGVKAPDYKLIKELYGEQLVKEIKNLVDYYQQEDDQWNLKVIREGECYADVVLYTSFSSNLYDVNKDRKIICSESSVGSVVCEELLKLMNSIKN
jgi:AAA+ superfamily predicted ATPase